MLEPGDRIDIWVVDKALGSGGMGSVYRCHNAKASRILAAVKVLESTVRRHPESEARFIREAEILFSLDHPHIVKVRNVRTDTEPPYLEMEFVEGQSLESLLRQGPLPLDRAMKLMKQMASSVAYLHAMGVRHRDIKPSNLLVNAAGSVKLVDFGLAMEADTTRITQQGMAFGTVSYAPPEWITPDKLDPERWDLYALGVVYYEVLTGKLAFPVSGQGSARQQAMQVIVGKQSAAPLDPGEAFSDDMRELIRSMTHKLPERRPASADQLCDLLEQLEPSSTAGARLGSPGPLGSTGKTWNQRDDERGPHTPKRDKPGDPDTTQPPSSLRRSPPVSPRRAPPTDPSLDPPTVPLPATSLPAPPSSTRRWSAALLVGALLSLGTTVALAVAAAALLAPELMKPSVRDVDVIVTGLDPETRLGLRLGDAKPSSVDDFVFHFEGMPVGRAELNWVIGDRCPIESCPGTECPAWCGAASSSQDIEAGEAEQVLTLPLKPPEARRVRILMPNVLPDTPVEASLDGVEARVLDSGDVIFDDVLPGRHRLTLSAGQCEQGLGCWPDGACPPGCTSVREPILVPWGSGEFGVEHALPQPEQVTAAIAPRPIRDPAPVPAPEPAPAPGPEPAPGASSATAAPTPVTNQQFARWLKGNPEWTREPAIEAKRADENYLAGWDGATPPAGKQSHAAVNVSWYAAAAFCSSRGGLASVEAEPHRWSESAQTPYIEWRTSGGKAAWRTSDGRPSEKVIMKQATELTGFRCAK